MPAIPDLAAAKQRVQEHLATAWKAAAVAKRDDLRSRLKAESDRQDAVAPATLLVVGETKRGKSSLINALVRAPSLVPVDADVATAVAVQIRYGARPAAHVFVEGTAEARRIDPTAVVDWASTWGRHSGEAATLVTVEWPSELLARGITLVDTPGVGGLDPAHRQVTLAQLDLADALLFVLDASEQLSRPELTFLEEARTRVDTVLIAMTKIDRHPQWRAVLDKNLELISGLGRDLAETRVVPVSSTDALLADQLAAEGDADSAAAIRADSGYDELEQEILTRVTDRRAWVRLTNLTRVTDHALGELVTWHQNVLASSSGDTRPLADLEREIVALGRAGADASGWLRRLLDNFSDTAARLSSTVTEMDHQLRSDAEDRIADWRPTTVQSLPVALDAELQAATLRLSRLIPEQAARAALEVAEHLGVVAEFLPPPQVELPTLEAVAAARARSEPGLDTEMALKTGLALTMGQGAGAALAAVAGLMGIPVITPVAIGIGLAIGGLNARVTRESLRRARGQAQVRRAVGESVGLWSSRARAETTTQLTRLRHVVERGLSDAVAARSAELARQMAELKESVQAARAAAGVRAHHEQRVAELVNERSAVAATLEALRAAG